MHEEYGVRTGHKGEALKEDIRSSKKYNASRLSQG